MDIQPGTIYEVTSPLGVYIQPSNGTGTQNFTIDGSSPDVLSGGVRLLDTAGGAPSTYTQYDTAPPLGPAFFVAGDGGHTNIQISGQRDVTVPQLSVTADPENIGTGAEGRVLYASQDGGVTLVFVGFIDATTSINGNNARIRTTQVAGVLDVAQAALDIDARVPVGSEAWVGDVGDDGSSTSFFQPGQGGSATTLTAATLHGGQTYNHVSFGTKISSATVFTIEIKR